MDEVTDDEIARYKKRSLKQSPTKARHKHGYEPCVFEYIDTEFNKTKGFIQGPVKYIIGERCPICGKISMDNSKWYQFIPMKEGCHAGQYVPTVEAQAELDPKTRTLQTYRLENMWSQKYVLEKL